MPNEVFGTDFYREMAALALSEIKALRANVESLEADRDWRAETVERLSNTIDCKNVEIDSLHARLEDQSHLLGNVREDLRQARAGTSDQKWIDAFKRYDCGWEVFAVMGHKIEAIKEYRRVYQDDLPKVGLKEAKDAIEKFLTEEC